MDSFSKRFGFKAPPAAISIRHEAPDWLRTWALAKGYELNHGPKEIREWICKATVQSPDSNRSSDRYVREEVEALFGDADWWIIYDFLEWLYARARQYDLQVIGSMNPNSFCELFERDVNEVLVQKGVGWTMYNGRFIVRGDEGFQEGLETAATRLEESGRSVALNELREAIADLSLRPKPEITGAIQHSMAALECVARDLTGDTSTTLGDWLKRNRDKFPTPVYEASHKLWGYASEFGRHVREGRPPEAAEAEFVVRMVASLIPYLIDKSR